MNVFQNGSSRDLQDEIGRTNLSVQNAKPRINMLAMGLLFISFSAVCGFMSWIIIEYMSNDNMVKGSLFMLSLGAGAGSFVGGLVFFSIPVFEHFGCVCNRPVIDEDIPHIPSTLFQRGPL